MLNAPSTPQKQRQCKVRLEKIYEYEMGSIDSALEVKSLSKLHESPAKKRVPKTMVSLPPIPSVLFNDQNCNEPNEHQRRHFANITKAMYQCPNVLTTHGRRFYSIAWMVGLSTMIFLSLRSSISHVPATSLLYDRSEMNQQLHQLTQQNINIKGMIGTQSRYDMSSIVLNESIERDVAESSSASTKDLTAVNIVSKRKNDEGTAVLGDKSKGIVPVVVSSLPSPYSTYQRNTTHAPRFAYTYVISGCNEEAAHRNYLYDIAISTYLQRESGSTADVIVFIQMAYESKLEELIEPDQVLLQTMNIHVRYIPKAADESFYRTMLDKFLILGLTQYERVLFMDGDVMVRRSLDYLFELSIRGVLKRNIVTAGKTEPANGGLFMVSPSDDATSRIMAIISDKEERGSALPFPHWDENVGWGHRIEGDDFARLNSGQRYTQWNFYGAFADQGLLYHWVKYEEKSVSIIFKHSVENWDVDVNGTISMEQRLGMDIFDEFKLDFSCWNSKLCITPFKDFIHFTGKSKPWLRSPPEGFETDSTSSPPHFWYHTLNILNDKMNLKIDFTEWRQFHRPLLGLYPTHKSASKTWYAVANDRNSSAAVKETK